MTDLTHVKAAAAAFLGGKTIESIEPFGDGHINDTYLVIAGDTHAVLQRINHFVFTKPFELMENAVSIACYIRRKLEAAKPDGRRETLRFLKTVDGADCWHSPEGGTYWRAHECVECVVSHSQINDPQQMFIAGGAFGEFMALLDDYPVTKLHETIPNFHNTPLRYTAMYNAIANNKKGRAAEVKADIDFALARQEYADKLVQALARGELPLRVTHNDTKINNVLLDEVTGGAVCVIDFDTVMPGLAAYDYGDSIRFGANTAAEDEPDLQKVNFSREYFQAYDEGYLQAAGHVLKPGERESLMVGVKMITLEQGIRFLTDHLNGDVYFKIHRPNHNLDRARTQFKLVADMEKMFPQLVR